MVIVRPANRRDRDAWLRLRVTLWPDGSQEEHRHEIAQCFAGDAREPLEILVAEDERSDLVGFVELSIRPCAEGCRSNQVAYLEGWFVAPEARRQGIGRALVAAAEAWARDRGCTEFASDSHPENVVSVAAHQAVGFADVGLVRCFRKDL